MTTLRELLAATPAMDSISADAVLTTMLIALVCSVIIYLVYRFFNSSPVYNPGFNLLTVMVCCITAFIIITISSNLVLSLGMVGALSIVRFRAAVKDPMDVGFLFWGVAAGLTSGAGLYTVALLGTASIALIYMLFFMLRFEKRGFLFIIRYNNDKSDEVAKLLTGIKHKLKNKTITAEFTELTLEVKIKNNDDGYLKPIMESAAITTSTLVEYTGDYT